MSNNNKDLIAKYVKALLANQKNYCQVSIKSLKESLYEQSIAEGTISSESIKVKFEFNTVIEAN